MRFTQVRGTTLPAITAYKAPMQSVTEVKGLQQRMLLRNNDINHFVK